MEFPIQYFNNKDFGRKNKQNSEKKLAAEKAVEFVKDGMIVGIGTGSTVFMQ